MQSNLQKKSINQSSSDLTLVLLGYEAKAPFFPVFHSRTIEINAWSVLLDIIGESHRIRVQHKSSGLGFTEILACLPPDSEVSAPLYKGKLSDWEKKDVDRNLKQHRYTFSYKKLNFSDENYESTILDAIAGGTDIISYDFASNRKDGVSDFYGPMTMISVAGGDLSIEWNSLHGYPRENSSILSRSRLAVD